MENTVSIIILIQDRYDLVKRCIDSIIAHTTSKFELILIVQGKVEDRIIDYINSLNVDMTVHYNDTNTGVTPGRNLGMTLARGNYLLFFDDDAFVQDNGMIESKVDIELDWLERMKKFFNLPKVGVVGQSGYLINSNNWGIFYTPNDDNPYVDVAQGYCFMFSRELFKKAGLLDEAYGKFWHEESDYALHAKSLGFKVVNAGYIGVFHLGSGSGDDGSYGKKLDYLKNKWQAKFPVILENRF